MTVLFDNVLGSTGSAVPPLRQPGAGGSLTVTHAEMQRYFMTVLEAAAPVLQCALMSRFPQPPGARNARRR